MSMDRAITGGARGSLPADEVLVPTRSPAVGIHRSERSFPWRLDRQGWWQVLRRAAKETVDDHVLLLAGGVAFFAFLAIFPAMAAFVAFYGLMFDPTDVAQQMIWLKGVVPTQAITMLHDQLDRLTAVTPESLSLGAVVALVVAMWSASRGSLGLLEATNLAYDEHEDRGFLHLNLLSLALTLGGVVFVLTALFVVAVVPSWLATIGLDLEVVSWLRFARWPALMALVLLASACIYHWAPDRRPARWQWLTPGSVWMASMVLVVSGLFSLYISTMGRYNEVYGSLGAVAVTLLWFYLLALLLLVGAELNQSFEQIVLERTTTAATSIPIALEPGDHERPAAGRPNDA